MIEIKDRNLFGLAVKNALLGIENARINTFESIRLLNAISKATLQIENNGVFMDYDEESGELLIWSQKSNEIYTANGICQCAAFKFSQVCWHRVAARLWRNYLELLKAADDAAVEEFAARMNSMLRVMDAKSVTSDAVNETSGNVKSLHERTAEQNDAMYLKTTVGRPVEIVGGCRI